MEESETGNLAISKIYFMCMSFHLAVVELELQEILAYVSKNSDSSILHCLRGHKRDFKFLAYTWHKSENLEVLFQNVSYKGTWLSAPPPGDFLSSLK